MGKDVFNKFSIDSHPILWNEKLYMFYSVNDWIGTDEKVAGTIILLDEMLSPEQFAGIRNRCFFQLWNRKFLLKTVLAMGETGIH